MSLYNDWRDLFRAATLGFSDRRIALHAGGVAVSYLVFGVLFYIEAALNNVPPNATFRAVGVSLNAMLLHSTLTWATVASAIFAVAVWLAQSSAVAKIAFEQLRGDHFYAGLAAQRYAWENRRGSMYVLIALIAVIGALTSLAYLFALPGRLGAFGEWWIALNSWLILPGFFVGLIVVFLSVLVVFGLIFLPAIVGVMGDSASENSYQLAVFVWKEGWRFVAYQLLLTAIALGAGIIFAAVGLTGLTLITERVTDGYPFYSYVLHTSAQLAWGDSPLWAFSVAENLSAAPLAQRIAVFFTTAGLCAVTVILVGYVLSVISTGNTLIYVVLRRRIRSDDPLAVPPSDAGHDD